MNDKTVGGAILTVTAQIELNMLEQGTITEWGRKSLTGSLHPLNRLVGEWRVGKTLGHGQDRLADYSTRGEDARFQSCSEAIKTLKEELHALQSDYGEPGTHLVAEQMALYGAMAHLIRIQKNLLDIMKRRHDAYHAELRGGVEAHSV